MQLVMNAGKRTYDGPSQVERSSSMREPAEAPDGAEPSSPPADSGAALLSQPLRVAYCVVLGLLVVSLLGLLFVHVFHSSGKSKPIGAATATTTTVSTRHTTTTVALPSSPKPSAEAAALALVSSWSTGNRFAALSVGTPTAVAALFAVPYPSGLAIDRGCSTSFSPIVCTFGPPGGASPTDPIYQVLVSQMSGGWYVSSVKVQQ